MLTELKYNTLQYTRRKRNSLVGNKAPFPDGHFHLGNHHYTADRVRYWSPHCALCIPAKASGRGSGPKSAKFSNGLYGHKKLLGLLHSPDGAAEVWLKKIDPFMHY
jgi:hypothetical protein